MRSVLALGLLAACSSSGDDGPPVSACDVTHFAAAPADFALPAVGAEATRTPFAQIADFESIVGMLDPNRNSVISYATTDMDGDNKPDLVMTQRNAMPGIGTSRWLVYPNTGTGFGAPIDFVLPGVGAEASRTPFAHLADSQSIIGMLDANRNSVISYGLVDMDGDRKPDLVITERNAMTGVGTTKWLVFLNTGTGFTEPMEFALPAVGAVAGRTPFAQIADVGSIIGMLDANRNSVISYGLLDFDGDRKPDLVMTERNAMTGVGASRWLLFKNTGTGFAATPADIQLPGVGAEASRTPFAQIADAGSIIGMLDANRNSIISYSMTDMDADGKPDLVFTERNALPGIGTSKWQVFPNTGTGFGAPMDFVLPGMGAEPSRTPFAQLADNESILGMLDANRNSVMAYATTDLDGDRMPDLVITERNAVAGVGTARWQVFPNTGTGFGEPFDFALPAVGAEATRTPFAQLADNESILGMLDANRNSVIAYATTDLDGDGKVDLVLTERNKEAGVGVGRWQVFNGSCN
jgi:hypothetical protein